MVDSFGDKVETGGNLDKEYSQGVTATADKFRELESLGISLSADDVARLESMKRTAMAKAWVNPASSFLPGTAPVLSEKKEMSKSVFNHEDKIGRLVEKYWNVFGPYGRQGLKAGLAIARAEAMLLQAEGEEKEVWKGAIKELKIKANVGVAESSEFERGLHSTEALLVDLGVLTEETRAPTLNKDTLGFVAQNRIEQLEVIPPGR